jgi:capsule biosynthesis phosphatase
MANVKKKRVFCFDIDNVICKTINNNYKNSKPSKKAIKKINQLYKKGHIIKLFTGRYMGRNNDNVTKAKKQGYKMTMKQLKKWNIKYHKLIFGKPSFDLYIDDKALFFKDNWYKFIDKCLIVK